MSKLLISWYAYNNDFMIEQKGNQRRNMGFVNEEGPTFTVHKHFWASNKFEKHIILNSGLSKEDKSKINLLKTELNKNFKDHSIEIKDVEITDPINVSEIFEKLQSLLAELADNEIEIFISPGTPAMQTAWYLLGTHFKRNVTLFQIRAKEFTKDKTKPEKIIVSLDSSVLPTNIVVAQKTIEKDKTSKDILITQSLEPIYERAKMIARTNDVGCLILGENGTGKENLAQFIHDNSNRSNKPFIAVNCASFSDELLRSELFGHEKGSFTGAESKKMGVFEAANGGTVFLDEIGDISPKMQVSLLRVLQSKKIQAVGSTKEIDINVRVLAATNRDIETMCDEDKFRTDLFYRLAVTELKLPALRERGKKEVVALINHFNNLLSNRFQKNDLLKISKEALECLSAYGYKGNVRELENMFIHFYTFCEKEINVSDLPKRVLEDKSITLTLADNEKQHILKVFNLNKGNILVTSKSLDVHRDTLKRKLQEYGVRESKE
ncbi:sigma 54-interacting transcriptional regulator [Flavobacterium sp.]|uniref:sigma 54-interacting transcriptional regulator n=1 Tax=Flavobacterium sp. TaxID=239 RepID=UPI0035B3831A